jgi:hypothetical protein
MRNLLLALVVVAAGCAKPDSAPDSAKADFSSVRLAIDGRTNANASIAARDSVVAVTWSGATDKTTDIFAAVSRDGGVTFAAPSRVNRIDGDARANSEFPPRVALTGTNDLVVVWTTRRADSNYIVSARSTDGGKTFSDATPIPGSVGKGNRGWESLAVDSAGRVMVLWLDHRDTPAMGAMHHHGGGPDDPTMTASYSKLYFASLDGGQVAQLTGGVCYCCKTSLVTAGSNVYAAWRHVYPGTIRDIAFAMSRDGGKTFSAPLRVSEDNWKIDGCPENGPALAVDDRKQVHIAWVTPTDGKTDGPLGLFYSVSADGAPFAKRTQVPSNGPASHAQIAVQADDQPIIAWDEISGGARHAAFATISRDSSGVRFTRLQTDSNAAGWPIVAANKSVSVIGWAAGNAIVIQRIR